jgi:hypothetical protein
MPGGLFEIRNTPFFAYGLNFLDIVETKKDDAGRNQVLRVVEPSGHRTLRVIFADLVPPEDRGPMLSTLNELQAFYEGANKDMFAIDIRPSGDYDGVRKRIDEWQKAGLLGYETCEVRVAGSFDRAPGGRG